MSRPDGWSGPARAADDNPEAGATGRPLESPVPPSLALEEARRAFRNYLARWAMDALELRRRGLDTPTHPAGGGPTGQVWGATAT